MLKKKKKRTGSIVAGLARSKSARLLFVVFDLGPRIHLNVDRISEKLIFVRMTFSCDRNSYVEEYSLARRPETESIMLRRASFLVLAVLPRRISLLTNQCWLYLRVMTDFFQKRGGYITQFVVAQGDHATFLARQCVRLNFSPQMHFVGSRSRFQLYRILMVSQNCFLFKP